VQNYLKKHYQGKPQLVAFFSMVDLRKSLHHQSIHAMNSHDRFCKSFIPTRSIIEKMGIYRAPLPKFSPDSKATNEYKAVWEEIKTRTL
jgi:cellulose biosynthesis protein BcsQ